MDIFTEIETFIEKTGFYRDFLSHMPTPLNNIYFDTVLLLFLMAYLIYRLADRIMMSGRHRRLRKKQEEMRMQAEADRQLREEEARLQQGKLAAFFKYMEMQMRPQTYQKEERQRTQGLGGKLFKIGSTHTENDFEILMREAKRSEDDDE